MQSEQRALAHRLVANVQLGSIVRRQRVAFVMIQAIAISGDARHENVAMQFVADGAHRAFDVRGGSAALPIVDVVEHYVEILARQRRFHGLFVVAVGHDIFHAPTQVVLGLAMQNRDGMVLLQQLGHHHAADELRSPDHQTIHV